MERVEGGGHGEPNQDELGRRICLGREALLRATPLSSVGMPHRFAATLCKGSVAAVQRSVTTLCGGMPGPFYKEYARPNQPSSRQVERMELTVQQT